MKSRVREPTVVLLIEDMYDEFYLGYVTHRLRLSGISTSNVGIDSQVACRGRGGLNTKLANPPDAIEPRLLDGVIIPVSYAPSHKRVNRSVINLINRLASTGRTVAALTISFRAVWLMASADILRGRRMATSDCGANLAIQAGAILVNDDVVSDGQLITGARPGGISRFMTMVTNALLGSGEIDPLLKMPRPRTCSLHSSS